MIAALCRLGALGVLSVLLVLPAGAQARPEVLLERARVRGDSAPSQLFYELAAQRDAQAFRLLRKAFGCIEDQGLAVAAFGACSLFKGSELEEQVADWLVAEAFKSESAAHQLAATAALTYFWLTEEAHLQRIVKDHPSAQCRALAIAPLLPQLIAKGSRSACKLVFENASLADRSERRALLAALRSFESRSAHDYLTGRLREQSLDTERKLLLLDLFEAREDRLVLAAIEKRLGDPIDAVRLRAMQILGRQRDGQTMERLKRIAKHGDEAFVVSAIKDLAQGHEGGGDWIEELYGFTHDQSTSVRLGAAHALGRIPTQDALTLLHKLLLDGDREVRLVALEEVAKKRQQRSVPRLIHALAKSEGHAATELARSLRMFTGQDHGHSGARWRAWFEAEGGSFQMPTLAEAERLENERLLRRNAQGELRTASFYGLRIESDHVTFVIDLSGSMNDPANGRGSSSKARNKTRLDVAKQELRNALSQLLSGVMFNVVTFSSDVSSLEPQLSELNSSSRARALRMLESWTANGGTAIYDGLVRALEDRRADTIYLLTDGEPTMGEVTDPEEIRRRISELCKQRKVRIHGVAIGRASPLLMGLTSDTGGHYIEIL